MKDHRCRDALCSHGVDELDTGHTAGHPEVDDHHIECAEIQLERLLAAPARCDVVASEFDLPGETTGADGIVIDDEHAHPPQPCPAHVPTHGSPSGYPIPRRRASLGGSGTAPGSHGGDSAPTSRVDEPAVLRSAPRRGEAGPEGELRVLLRACIVRAARGRSRVGPVSLLGVGASAGCASARPGPDGLIQRARRATLGRVPRSPTVAVLAFVPAAIAGCVDFGGGPSGAANSAPPCSEYVPLASPADIAKTPRQNVAAEVLALEVSGDFVAPDALYERIRADLETIVALDPTLANIGPASARVPSGVTVQLDEPSFSAHLRGDYHGWDCPNAAYGGRILRTVELTPAVHIGFGARRLDGARLVAEYSKIPGVLHTSPSGAFGEGSTICLEVDGLTHRYVFVEGWGDCLAGCTGHRYTGFDVTPGAAPTALGSFLSGTPEGGTDPFPDATPAWFDALGKCGRRR